MFKRVVLTVGVVLGIVVVSPIAWNEVTSRMTSNRLHQRAEHWTSVVNSGVTVGEPRDQAERWLRKTFPTHGGASDVYDPDRNSLVAVAETVKVAGMQFPCAAWVVVVDLQLGADNRVTSRQVRTSGICV